MTNIQDLSAWLTVAQGVGVLFLGAIVYYLRTAFLPRREFKQWTDDAGQRLTSQSDRLGLLDNRTTRVEDKMGAMPTQMEMNKLTVAMSDLRGDVRVLTKQLEGIERKYMQEEHRP